MNGEVSHWMKGLTMDDYSEIPFTAMKGYDSVVWSRLYSRDTSDLNDHQINQVSNFIVHIIDIIVLF